MVFHLVCNCLSIAVDHVDYVDHVDLAKTNVVLVAGDEASFIVRQRLCILSILSCHLPPS